MQPLGHSNPSGHGGQRGLATLSKATLAGIFITSLAGALLALQPGCVSKQTSKAKCNGPKGAAAVKPPSKTPDCKQACQYFVHCQSARWTPAEETAALQERCQQDCKAIKPKSQEEVFFGGIKRCAVGKACVAFGECMRQVIAELRKRAGGDEPQEDPNAIYNVPVAGSPSLGPADALVTVVMFADYECPYCGRGWATVKQLTKAFPGKVRLVYKHYPLPNHPQGKVGAEAAACVMKQKGLPAFWQYHQRLYQASDDLSEKALLAHAKAVGADPAAVKQCMQAGTHKALLAADLKLGTQLGVDGTPAFYVNGKKLAGAQPLEAFKKAYTEALGRAEAAVQSGVKPADVYQHLTGKGATRPVYLKGKGPRAGQGPGGGPPELDDSVVFRVPVSRNDPTKGPADALVTIVEFADFQCPACVMAGQRMQKILKEFPKDVRLIFRQNPLPSHTDAALAAEAALAVRAQKGDAGFFAYHDKLFAHARDLSRPVLERLAGEVGVDLARFKKALDAGTYKPQVEADRKFAEQMGVMGTPAFYINGRIMMGLPPTYDALKARIQQEINAAKKLLKGGVTRQTLYAKITASGKTEPVFKKPQ